MLQHTKSQLMPIILQRLLLQEWGSHCLVLSTKGGYIPIDYSYNVPAKHRYCTCTYVKATLHHCSTTHPNTCTHTAVYCVQLLVCTCTAMYNPPLHVYVYVHSTCRNVRTFLLYYYSSTHPGQTHDMYIRCTYMYGKIYCFSSELFGQ